MVLLLSRAGFESDQLDDFKGLNQRSPWWAFIMLLVMFSLAGMPPTIGFYAKFMVIAGGRQRRASSGSPSSRVLAVADRRVLLPAHRQADVFRRSRGHAPIVARGDTRCCCRRTGWRCCCSASCRSR